MYYLRGGQVLGTRWGMHELLCRILLRSRPAVRALPSRHVFRCRCIHLHDVCYGQLRHGRRHCMQLLFHLTGRTHFRFVSIRPCNQRHLQRIQMVSEAAMSSPGQVLLKIYTKQE